MVKLICTRAYNGVFNNQKQEDWPVQTDDFLTDDSFIVEKHKVVEDARSSLGLSFFIETLNYAYEKKYLNIDQKERDIMLRMIKTEFYHKRHHYLATEGYLDLCAAVEVFVSVLEKSSFFSKIINSKKQANGLKQTVKYNLPTSANSLVMSNMPLPHVIPFKNVKVGDIQGNLTRSLVGDNKITQSESFVKILNIAQSKKLSTNTVFANLLFEALRNKELVDLDLPFKHEDEITKIAEELKEYNHCFDSMFFREMRHEVLKNVTGRGLKQPSSARMSFLLSAPSIQYAIYATQHEKSKEFNKERLKRKHAMTILDLANIYSNISPLYISNKYCVRLRLYPKEALLSRTSGGYKSILQDHASITLTYRGVINLLFCYYAPSKELTEKLKDYVDSLKNKNKKKLYSFFEKNYLDFRKVKDTFMYTSNLHASILIARETGKCQIGVEIDQVASAFVFLAFVTRNKKMAELANLTSTSKKDIYAYSQECFEDFYNKKMVSKNEEVFHFIVSSRKIHKYALMCFCYGEESKSRLDSFIEVWIKEKKNKPTSDEYDVLKDFAFKYDDFINTIFPGLTESLEILEKTVDIVVPETNYFSLRNINGEMFHYARFLYDKKRRQTIDPIRGKTADYQVYLPKMENGVPVNDLRTHKRLVRSYFIHSIDAGVMHHFIKVMKENHNYIINHVHDCIIIHPNKVDDFYKEVHELYTSDKLYNVTKNCLFDAHRQIVSLNSQHKIDDIEKEFFKGTEDFFEDLKKISILVSCMNLKNKICIFSISS
jgi:hypothetical protein